MAKHPQQPQKDDVVMGGQSIAPDGAIVLGGLEGLKKRLKSPVAEQRSVALSEAFQYGQQGLNLVIRALQDQVESVRQTAYALLESRSEPQAKQAIEQFYIRTNYTRLQSTLAAGSWREADQETRMALCTACGLSPFSQPQPVPIRVVECPCQDLRIIDQLWVKYSQGRFGFSVQQAIWEPCRDRYWEKSEVWSRFGDRVGWRSGIIFGDKHWRRYDELMFSIQAPIGHLPFLGDGFGIFTIEAISNRLTRCAAEPEQSIEY
jgi:hypothetical protein